ncbi:hypothetical protein AAULR_22049 [Lacticaseibacillus rhamnosus MTCC 5462]|nr:hypothetical protein AAULR_22049 [Lacticaseibacillus rhamnosus MTCC 5462]
MAICEENNKLKLSIFPINLLISERKQTILRVYKRMLCNSFILTTYIYPLHLVRLVLPFLAYKHYDTSQHDKGKADYDENEAAFLTGVWHFFRIVTAIFTILT